MRLSRSFASSALLALVVALVAGCSSGHSSSPTSPSGQTGGSGSGTWSRFTVDSSGDVGSFAHLAADSAGHVAISYLDFTTSMVRCARKLGSGTWSIADLGTAAGPYVTGGNNSIALKSDGSPVVLFHRADVAYMWTAWNGSAWTTPAALSWTETAWAFLGGNAIGIDRTTGQAMGALELYDSHVGWLLGGWGSGTSSATAIDGPNGGHTGKHPSVAVDAAGRMHVAYEYQATATGKAYLKYGRLSGGTWTFSVVDSMGDDGNNTSSRTAIAVDPFGAPGIVYYSDYAGYKYAHWNGASWDISLIDSYGSVGWLDESIVFDLSGNPHVAIATAGYKLKYAYRVGGSWIEETADPAAGLSCSIGITGGGKVYIAYYDDMGHRLRLAVRTP